MQRIYRSSFRLLAFSFLLCAGVAQAAPAVTVPSTAEPGRAGDRMSLQPELPEVGGEPLITLPGEGGQETRLKDNASFTLKSVTVEGNTAFTGEELKNDYKDFIDQTATLNTLNEIAAKITARYRNAGYILSRAVVPPQRIEHGAVIIRIVEGRINKVEFQGVSGSGVLREYADKLQAESPLNAQSLERYLLLMDDLPGITARAVIRPSEEVVGAADLVVVVTQKPFDVSASLDNRGTRYLGPVQAGLTVSGNNMLGLNDRTQLHAMNTAEFNELHYGQFLHEEQLDSEGTKLTFSASRTKSAPKYKIASFDIEGADDDYSLAVSHPFIRSRQSNLYGTLTLEARETNNDALNQQLSHDSLRVTRLDGAYDFIDSFSGVNRVEATLAKGFGWDTSPDGGAARSRTSAHPEFYKGNLQASRLQQISGPFAVYVAASGQMASDTLLASEEFGLGGPAFGSAYDASEVTGDAGVAGRIELRYSREGDLEWIPAYQFYTFYDVGKVWLRDAAANADTASLASAGGGVRFNILTPISASLELAEPLTRPVAADNTNFNGNRPRVFFSLAYHY